MFARWPRPSSTAWPPVLTPHSAIEKAGGRDAEQWRQDAHLLAACAAADGPDPAGAAQAIERYAAALNDRGQRLEVAFCWPFLAVALSRSGEHTRALQVIEGAATAFRRTPVGSPAAVNHTRAMLLAKEGSHAAKAALAYGDSLAEALWRQRQGTLHTATTIRSLDRLRRENEQVAHTAETDSVTQVPNRWAFDRVVESMKGSGDDRHLSVLVVDLDKFKAVNDARGTRRATMCCRRWRPCWPTRSVRVISSPAWAATSSACCYLAAADA